MERGGLVRVGGDMTRTCETVKEYILKTVLTKHHSYASENITLLTFLTFIFKMTRT